MPDFFSEVLTGNSEYCRKHPVEIDGKVRITAVKRID